MGIILQSLQALTRLAPVRPALTPSSFGSLSTGIGATASSNTSALSSMTASGWVFAVIDRIASSIAAVEWRLYQRMGNGEREEIPAHPALNVWAAVNPFMTREEYLEVLIQHFELVGEMWTVVIPTGVPAQPFELWAVRPDHIRPVPHPTQYLTGYIYQMPGTPPIPLEINQVIYIRRPNPMSAYRGIGVLQSILADVDAEQRSAQWTATFFRNSAEPGGIIEVEDAMGDAEFDKFVLRWRQQHQGVSNAHRVAILEGGMHWKDRQLSQRDMQFEQLRKLNRDSILGAWGVSPSIVGITEHVNRANAEAAEVTFANRNLVPRLRRIRAELNETYLPLFKDARRLEFDFDDPTPPNRELALMEASQGYVGGYLTQNEARSRIGEAAIESGNEFKPAPAAPFSLALTSGERHGQENEGTLLKESDPAGLLTSPLEAQEGRMRRAWERRLRQEGNAIASYIEQFKTLTKLEPTDIEGYSWDWWIKYGKQVMEELTRAFTLSIQREFPDMPIPEVQRLAGGYARTRGGELLQVTGEFNLVDLTRRRVGQIVANALEKGDSLQKIQKALRSDFVFSPARARMVARTESATALGQGTKEASIAQGRDEKHWVTQGDDVVSEECMANEDAGWLHISDFFPSGRDTIPQHPNCRCVVRFRTSALHEDSVKPYDARCPRCDKLLLARAQKKEERWCSRCNERVIA